MASVNPSNIAAVQGYSGLESLVVEVDKLVSLPDIYYRLEETIVDPTSTVEVISNLLRSDPDLCARMLSMANSAFYSFPTRIETIERAVSTIGLRQIRELVLVTAVVKAFEGIPPGTVNMETFWEPVGKHHDPGQSHEYQLAACAIHLADAWVNTHQVGRSGDGSELMIDEVALYRIDIESEQISEIGQAAKLQAREVARMFMNH
jgi:hypothetical protein